MSQNRLELLGLIQQTQWSRGTDGLYTGILSGIDYLLDVVRDAYNMKDQCLDEGDHRDHMMIVLNRFLKREDEGVPLEDRVAIYRASMIALTIKMMEIEEDKK